MSYRRLESLLHDLGRDPVRRFVGHCRAFFVLLTIVLAAVAAHADSPLGVTISILETEGGVLHLPADTSMPYYVDGFIGDPAGDPIAGVSVSDGTQTTTTRTDGTWSLPEPAAGQYIVTMKSDRTDTAVYRLTAPGVPVVYGAVVTLPYNIGVSSWSVLGEQATVTVATTAPANDVCVKVVDAATGTATAASATGSNDAGGASLWSATIPSSVQRIRVVARRCSSQVALTDTRSVSYPLERTASAPSGATYWFNTPNPVIAFAVNDQGGSGVDIESVAVVVDGVALAVGPFVFPAFEAQARGLSDGVHAASVSLADNVGNATTIPLTIAIDTTGPEATGLFPAEGDTTGPSPAISVSVADDASGVNAGASRFVLTNGMTSSTVRPSLNGGALTYQVPDTGIGTNLGEGPLPPGFYTVDVYVQDAAGNETHTSAFFAVLPF
jgi:hypothetical protein